MDYQQYDQILKTQLQTLGAIRPQAWKLIVQLAGHTQLDSGESLIRRTGDLAYVCSGLLKEYDAYNRKNPSIINFSGGTEFLVTRLHNQHHYLKACTPTLAYHWELSQLQQLHSQFPELKTIYDQLCAGYDRRICMRQQLLEQRFLSEKISLFIKHNRSILPQLKKKDIANYLNIDYDYFIRHFSRHL